MQSNEEIAPLPHSYTSDSLKDSSKYGNKDHHRSSILVDSDSRNNHIAQSAIDFNNIRLHKKQLANSDIQKHNSKHHSKHIRDSLSSEKSVKSDDNAKSESKRKHDEEKTREKEKKREEEKKHEEEKKKHKHHHKHDKKKESEQSDTTNTQTLIAAPNSDFQELKHPKLLYSCTIPLKIDDFIAQLEGNDAFSTILTNAGDTNITFTQWEEKGNYKERAIKYSKTINIPAIGTRVVQASENHKMYDLGNQYVLVIESDLGKTPYAEDFTPIVHINCEKQDDSVQYTANLEILWHKEPFLVKGIIEKNTIQAFKDFYTQFGNQFSNHGNETTNFASSNLTTTDTDSASPLDTKREAIKEENEMFAKKFIASVIVLLIVVILLSNWKAKMA